MANENATEWLSKIFQAIPQARVAVFGDFCVDAYWELDTAEPEKSVETGLPIRRVRSQKYSLGGAGNVVANLRDLGVKQVQAVGIVGSDQFGALLIDLLQQRGADASRMLNLGAQWQTMVYAKPCRGSTEENRIDFGAFNALPDEALSPLMDRLTTAVAASDIVILNQQIPCSVSSPKVIEQINRLIAAHPKTRFIVDARHTAGLFRGAMLKLNAFEASRLLGEHRKVDEIIPDALAKDFALRLTRQTGQPVFLTRSERGIVVAEGNRVEQVDGIHIVERTDPVGAGDTAVAALAATLAIGGEALSAARLANLAASITVRKLQTTGTATPQEILAVGADTDFVYNPELAEDPRQARYLEGTEIEQIGNLAEKLHIQHAIFDHDGTISVLREGWEKIMHPMMVRAILGPRFNDADPSLYRQVNQISTEFIDKTTGIQTLVQMKGLVQLVRQFGCVPEKEILDEHGYKRIYNEELLKMVQGRIRKLQLGELDSLDFQIKNAQRLLQALRDRGVKLYLASGTDEQDVIAEAQAMGYAGLFEGRIFGAVGKVTVEAKKVVLDRIINENRLQGHEFATFGDGPVEMRETRKRGGIAVGVASDEVRRFGMNMVKRSRLIKGGADLLVPDFSQLATLLKVLQVG